MNDFVITLASTQSQIESVLIMRHRRCRAWVRFWRRSLWWRITIPLGEFCNVTADSQSSLDPMVLHKIIPCHLAVLVDAALLADHPGKVDYRCGQRMRYVMLILQSECTGTNCNVTIRVTIWHLYFAGTIGVTHSRSVHASRLFAKNIENKNGQKSDILN